MTEENKKDEGWQKCEDGVYRFLDDPVEKYRHEKERRAIEQERKNNMRHY